MARVAAKNTYVSLDGNDLSTHTNESELERTSDTFETTCYGSDSKTYDPTLLDAKASLGGIYDSSAGGPRAVIEPLVGSIVTYVRRPEGTGSGLPEDSVSVVVTSYKESAPVADMVTWAVELQPTGDITSTSQT